MITTPEKLLEFVKEKNVKWVDLQFMDIQSYIQNIEVATAGQCEIDMKYDTLTKMGDNAHPPVALEGKERKLAKHLL